MANWADICREETVKKIVTSGKVRRGWIADPRLDNIPMKFRVSATMAFPGIIEIEACVLFLKEYGLTLKQIGIMIDRSPERIRQMLWRAKRNLNAIKQPEVGRT